MNILFNPTYCPNPDCSCHTPQSKLNWVWFVRRGARQLRKNNPHKAALFICKSCGRCFSESTFRIDYYEKVTISYYNIISVLKPGITLSEWSSALGTTPPTLKLRLFKLCWYLIEKLEHRSAKPELTTALLRDIQRKLIASEGEFILMRELILHLRWLFN